MNIFLQVHVSRVVFFALNRKPTVCGMLEKIGKLKVL